MKHLGWAIHLEAEYAIVLNYEPSITREEYIENFKTFCAALKIKYPLAEDKP